jgi:hypothetical protein
MNPWLAFFLIVPFGFIIPFAAYEVGKRFPGPKD